MVKFKFFIHCDGWATGGYENTNFAKNAKEAKSQINEWNKKTPNSVTLISIEEVSNAEFAEDFVGYC